MPTFWKHVNEVLREADIIIEVLDARFIDETRNREIEYKVRAGGKKILYVLNKCDLVNIEELKEKAKGLQPSVFISSREKLGTTILKKKILELSHGERAIVGVLGYPNVGKSSLINALSGRGSARTSSESGFTKGLQKVRVDSKIMLIDTPGVFPKEEKDVVKFGKTSAISSGKIKDPEYVALRIIEEEKERIKKHFGIEEDDEDEILERIAILFKKVRKGKELDLDAAARLFLKQWQEGKIQ
ncbi:MAG: GTPase [Nanoarchaeota archaeon]|nr:GTPase [Nanoarchaeota archaeon]